MFKNYILPKIFPGRYDTFVICKGEVLKCGSGNPKVREVKSLRNKGVVWVCSLGMEGKGVVHLTELGTLGFSGLDRKVMQKLKDQKFPTVINTTATISKFLGLTTDQRIFLFEYFNDTDHGSSELNALFGSSFENPNVSPSYSYDINFFKHKLPSNEKGRIICSDICSPPNFLLAKSGNVYVSFDHLVGSFHFNRCTQLNFKCIKRLKKYEIVDIAIHQKHILFLSKNEIVYSCEMKNNILGELKQITSPSQKAVYINANEECCYIVLKNGDTLVCGDNRRGQLGLPLTTKRIEFSKIKETRSLYLSFSKLNFREELLSQQRKKIFKDSGLNIHFK